MQTPAIEKPRASSHPAALATKTILGGVPQQGGKVYVLQALRGIAAIMVIFYHVSNTIFGMEKYWVDEPFGRIFEFSHSGVEFFFVLSGFIIYAAHSTDVGRPSAHKAFLWKRFKRVYPIYWIVLLIVIPVYLLDTQFGNGNETSPAFIFQSFSLIRLSGEGLSIVAVGWTLFHEVMFYALFSILILNVRLGSIGLALWTAGSVVVLMLGTGASEAMRFYFLPEHMLFGMGMLTAWVISRIRSDAAPFILLAGFVMGVAGFGGTGIEDVYGHTISADCLSLLYGIFSTLIIVSAVRAERQGLFRTPKFLTFLGDASYSIYLVHVLAISALAKIALVLTHHLAIPHVLIFLGLVAGGMIFGSMFHIAIETPMMKWLNRRFRKPVARAHFVDAT